MSVSTDGRICYGVLLEEDFELPWDNDKYDDIDDWWIYEICEYKNPFELFNEFGEYINGVKPSQEKIDKYFDMKHKFEKKHPLPITLVNYCSDEAPMYIVAIPETVITARRGYPEKLEFNSLLSLTSEKIIPLVEFCEKYLKIKNPQPYWYVSSYWG